jgi:hypothetical protein
VVEVADVRLVTVEELVVLVRDLVLRAASALGLRAANIERMSSATTRRLSTSCSRIGDIIQHLPFFGGILTNVETPQSVH